MVLNGAVDSIETLMAVAAARCHRRAHVHVIGRLVAEATHALQHKAPRTLFHIFIFFGLLIGFVN